MLPSLKSPRKDDRSQISNLAPKKSVSPLRSRLRLKVSSKLRRGDVDRWPRASGDPQFRPSGTSFQVSCTQKAKKRAARNFSSDASPSPGKCVSSSLSDDVASPTPVCVIVASTCSEIHESSSLFPVKKNYSL